MSEYQLYLNLDGIKYKVKRPEKKQTYPVKGDLITMDLGDTTSAWGTLHQYRVLSIDGSIAKVVAMYEPTTSQVFGSSQTYSGSSLDTYLNTTWYGTLSTEAKAAIVDQTITQKYYSYSDDEPSSYTYSYQWSWSTTDDDYATYTRTVSVGSRHVYALEMEDIFDYIGSNYISSNDLNTLFYKSTSKQSDKWFWLRSADAGSSGLVWCVRGFGGLSSDGYGDSSAARPAFNIDLSKISYEIVE